MKVQNFMLPSTLHIDLHNPSFNWVQLSFVPIYAFHWRDEQF